MDKQLYYHFLSADNAIEDLEKRRIKISTLNTLNDPFEFMPYRRYSLKERQPYNRVFREMSKKWGVLCFSKVWTEQLLWAHYADKHKGIALAFETPEDGLLKVEYDPSEIRKKFNLTDNPTENENEFLDLAKVKFKEWEYEKEYRLLVNFKNCLLDKGQYFITFSDNLVLRKIVLGCRFDHKKNKELIKKIAYDLKVKVVATREGWEDYHIHECATKTSWYKDITV